MFEITDQPLQPPTPDCRTSGGFVTFEGRVRTLNEGHEVERLEYEAYAELAVVEGTKLIEEAKQKFGLDWAYAVHRIGTLEIGEAAVWIGCAAAHRKEAFEACEFIIDEIKKRLPIWKKEHYADGPSGWVNLQTESASDKLLQSDVFARQMILQEVGPAGQTALHNARVLVVGAGGLGSAALPYLAGAGVGALGIVEPDLLEASNLHRQTLYGFEEIGRSKARLAAEFLRRMHPFVQTEVFEERLTIDNAVRIIEKFDIVLDGADSLDAKFLMNDICQKLGKPLVQASIYQFEGHVQTILPGGPCLRCLWPEAPPEGCVGTCAQSGVLGVTPGFFGILQASEVLKLILGFGEVLDQSQLMVDLNDYSMMKVARAKRAGCPSCAQSAWIRDRAAVDWEVLPDQIQAWADAFVCIDLREEDEDRNRLELGQCEWRQVPLSRFNAVSAIDPETRTVLVCASGARSGRLAYRLREQDRTNIYSLKGGAKS